MFQPLFAERGEVELEQLVLLTALPRVALAQADRLAHHLDIEALAPGPGVDLLEVLREARRQRCRCCERARSIFGRPRGVASFIAAGPPVAGDRPAERTD